MRRSFSHKMWTMDRCSSTGNSLLGSVRAVEKRGTLIQIEKVVERIDGDLTCNVFSFEDEVAHLSVSDPSIILTFEKWLVN